MYGGKKLKMEKSAEIARENKVKEKSWNNSKDMPGTIHRWEDKSLKWTNLCR